MRGSGMPGLRPRFFISLGATLSRNTDATERDLDLDGIEIALTAEDSHHALRVLRLSEGDACEVVVGAAVYAATVVVAADPVKVELNARLEGADAGADYRIQVGVVQALARPAAIDYVVEKGTEVGAGFFVLVQTGGSPKWSDRSSAERVARWRRIAKEAAKQSKQVAVPPVDLVGSLGEALDAVSGSGALSLVLEPTASGGLQEILAGREVQPARVALWVGPEGGWTAAELERFSSTGIETARLGRSVLRTETAGPVAVAVARLALMDW
jgi:16S rRNA (uracil1498-N3)-methyltransferase